MGECFIKRRYNSHITVDWTTGSEAQIAAMVAADKNGDIDLRDYWNVGDTRIVKLSAMPATNVPETHAEQYAELVLLHEGGDNDDYRFIVGLKNALLETGIIEDGSSSAPSASEAWSTTDRAAWCDNEFYNAIPSALRPIFKQWTCVSGYSKSTSDTESVSVYFALPAEKEVRGSSSQGSAAEANALFQFEYYATAANRIKYKGIEGTTAQKWWLRSPMYNTLRHYYVYAPASGTNTSYDLGSTSYGLAPIGRI